MACEPATQLVGRAGEAVCPSCGRTEVLPPNAVFVVTGASGAGKSTVYPYLRDLLVDCEVFETDQIVNYLSSDWHSFRSAWLMVWP